MAKTGSAAVKKAVLRFENVLVEDTVVVTRKGKGRKRRSIVVPVSVFRNKSFMDGKGRQISAKHTTKAIQAIRELYAVSLAGVAQSYGKENLPRAAMAWPVGGSTRYGIGRGGKRAGQEPVTLATDYDPTLAAKTGSHWNTYTSATLAKYRNVYGFSVPGYPSRKGKVTKGVQYFAKLRENQGVSKGAGQHGQIKKYHSLSGATSSNISKSLMASVGQIQNNSKYTAGISAKIQRRIVRKGTLTRRHIGGAPVHMVTGTLTGFEKLVKKIPFGNEIFAAPFAEGVLNEKEKFSVPNLKALKGALPVSRAGALLALNEGRRPYIRRFMYNQHKYILNHVKNALGLVE